MVDHYHVSSGVQNVGAGDDRSINFVPGEYTTACGEAILVALARPRGLVTTGGYIPPDQCLSISRALIRATVGEAR